MAAGTVTITEERLYNVKKIVFAWVAGTDGDAGTATGTTTYVYTGNILKAVTVPDGVAQPDDNYNVTITDADGIDVANGQLLLRDETNTEWVTASLGAVVGDKLTINVDSAGASNEGTCTIYVGTADTVSGNANAENALYGAGGITTWPAAAAPADGVSIAEGLRYVVEDQIGTLVNSGGTATLGGILGDVATVDVATSLSLIATADAGGLGATADSLAYSIGEVERHFHSYERWFGLAAAPNAEVHRADAIGAGIAAFQMDAGNNTWGSWLQILGSSDTPAVAGNTKFDLHKVMITDVERDGSIHLVQIACGTSGAAALAAGTYTEFVYKPQATNTEETPYALQMRRQAAGTKVWARVLAMGADTGTLDFYLGLHEYEG